MLNFGDFIQVYAFTTNHHLKALFNSAFNTIRVTTYVKAVMS